MQEKTLNNIAYKEWNGNINTILILHGWGGKSDSWIEVASLLNSKGYRVIVPDLPGWGKTKLKEIFTLDLYAKEIINFACELKLDNFILWGHSNGGAIAIKIINKNQLRIKKLILNNSAGIRNDKKRSTRRKILNTFSKYLRFLRKIPGLRKVFYKIIGSQDYLNSEKIPYLKETYQNIIGEDLQDEIKNISIPTLMIWGERDTYTPLRDGETMHKLINNSKFIVLDNEKHGIHLQNPKRLVEKVCINLIN